MKNEDSGIGIRNSEVEVSFEGEGSETSVSVEFEGEGFSDDEVDSGERS